MGILSAVYAALQNEIYSRVPAIRCRACGCCCVSPHMTLIEFAYLMRYLLGNPALLRECIARAMSEHPEYPGHLLCRFQSPDGLCAVYPARALACRLHGNPVMATAGMRYSAYCPHVLPLQSAFGPEDVYALMDRISELNQGYYSYYTQPYWVAGLSSEVWLTILFCPPPQPIFRLLRKIMDRELALQELRGCFAQKVHLGEKLAVIDRFQAALASGNAAVLRPLLHSIQHDFPDTGAYYYFEAEMYLKALQEKSAAGVQPGSHPVPDAACRSTNGKEPA